MKFSIHWLRKFVDIPESTKELADLLTMLGFEAEIPESNWDNKNIVSACLSCGFYSKIHPFLLLIAC